MSRGSHTERRRREQGRKDQRQLPPPQSRKKPNEKPDPCATPHFEIFDPKIANRGGKARQRSGKRATVNGCDKCSVTDISQQGTGTVFPLPGALITCLSRAESGNLRAIEGPSGPLD